MAVPTHAFRACADVIQGALNGAGQRVRKGNVVLGGVITLVPHMFWVGRRSQHDPPA